MAKKKTTRKKAPALAIGKVHIDKDPRVYASTVQAAPVDMKRCAGVDLGTSCGIAFADFKPGQPIVDVPIMLGQWDLSIGPYDSGILRLVRLKQFLTILQPDLVTYEEVKFTPGQELLKKRQSAAAIVARVSTAAEFLGALKATLGIWCEERNVPAHGLGISAIKKYATGKGNASKVQMIEAANEQMGLGFSTEDYEKTGSDNICDAAFCCKMGLEAYSEGMDL